MCWLLKQRAYENMRISWIRKLEDQMHIFEWEAILMATATGRRSVRTSACTSGDYYHIWCRSARSAKALPTNAFSPK